MASSLTMSGTEAMPDQRVLTMKAAGGGVVEASRVRREVITLGRLQGAGLRATQDIADYVLTYRNNKLAVTDDLRTCGLLSTIPYESQQHSG